MTEEHLMVCAAEQMSGLRHGLRFAMQQLSCFLRAAQSVFFGSAALGYMGEGEGRRGQVTTDQQVLVIETVLTTDTMKH